MTEQWSDRSAMLNHKTLPPSGQLSYLQGSALKTWTSYWKREGSTGMDTWNAPTVQSRQPLTYRLMESMGLGGPSWLGSSWHRGIAESGSSQLSTLTIETPGDLVWGLPCVHQASCLEGGPLLWIWPLYTSIQMKCQGGVIFVHAPRLFYCPKRRIGYAHCSLTGNNNYPAITKLTNTM